MKYEELLLNLICLSSYERVNLSPNNMQSYELVFKSAHKVYDEAYLGWRLVWFSIVWVILHQVLVIFHSSFGLVCIR